MMSAPIIGPAMVPRPPRNAISTMDRSNSGSNPDCGSTWVRYRNHTPPTAAVTVPDSTNAVSFTRMARTPSPRARSSSSLIARSCRPNLDRRIRTAMTIMAAAQPSVM